MVNKYTITLSDGVTQFFVYDLEQNGPGNVSVPRQIQNVVLAGGAGVNYFELNGDLTYRFVAGFTFTVSNSVNAGTYTVAVGGSTYYGSPNRTIIPVVQVIGSAGLPYGDIYYSIPVAEEATSILLAGSGTRNYGQAINTNLVHMLENFASSTPPANPITGQGWYDTTSGAFKIWDGVGFTSTINLNTFSVVFNDPQNPNGVGSPASTNVILTGSDPLYPGVGVSLRTLINPNPGNSIFRVLSADGVERLRVEHSGFVSTTDAFKQTSSITNNEFSSDILFANGKGIRIPSGASIRSDVTGTIWEITGDVNVGANTIYVNSTNNLVGIGGVPVVGGSPLVNVPFQVFGTADINGVLDMKSNKIVNVVDPVNPQDAATKNYVDVTISSLTASLDVKPSARVATAAALSTYTASGIGVGKTLTSTTNVQLVVDGVNVVFGDRVLVKDETGFSARHNGIYTVTQPGVTGVSPFILTRATDADQNSEVTAGMIVIVEEGSLNADTGWILVTDNPIVVDTTELSFTKFGSAPVTPWYDAQTSSGSAVFTTAFNFGTAPAGKTALQVFVNGVKQIEGTTKAYTITPPNTVTFNAGAIPVSGADVDFYGFG